MGVSESWMKIYEALAEYISAAREVDQNLLWMIEGTDDALPDVIYQLQRLKNALVDTLLKESAFDELRQVVAWFDRMNVVMAEKTSGAVSREHSFSKPYEAIFWKARDGMYISTIDGRFLHCNEALMTLLKYASLEDILKVDILSDLYVNKDQRQVMLNHLYRDGFYDHREASYYCADGEIVTTLESCYMVTSPQGERYIVGIIVDITREKETQTNRERFVTEMEKANLEAHLTSRREARRNEALMELNDHPVVVADLTHLELANFNQAFSKKFRYGKKHLDKLNLRDLFPKDHWMQVFSQISSLLRRHHYHIRDVSCITHEGDLFTANLSILVHEDDTGTHLFIQFEDRSELTMMEKDLSFAKNGLDLVLNSAPIGVIAFKHDGSVATINRYLLEFTGYGNRKLMDISFVNRLFERDDQRLKFNKYIRQFLRGKHAENVMIDLKIKSGEIHKFRLDTVSFAFNRDEKPGFLAFLTNITEQVELENMLQARKDMMDPNELEYHNLQKTLGELEERNESLVQRNRFKIRFMRTVLEKFKNPIHVVLGFASLLRQQLSDVLDKSHFEDLQIIEDQSHQLLDMLNKAAEFANLQSGKVPSVPEKRFVRPMLDKLFEGLAPEHVSPAVLFSANHQILSLDLEVTCDVHLLTAMLRHLLDNAVRFTSEGQIEVTAYEENEHLWLQIDDTGCGIPSNDLTEIFDPFYQGDNQPDKTVRGLGLGLTIARRYADLMGASVEVKARPDEGTRVLIQIGRLFSEDGDL